MNARPGLLAERENMTYKNFEKIQIGCSDIASLVARASDSLSEIHFGQDGYYHAYECFGDDVEIGAHYRKVFSGSTWLTIYDDLRVTYQVHSPNGFSKVDIYRAAEMGCIIHWHN